MHSDDGDDDGRFVSNSPDQMSEVEDEGAEDNAILEGEGGHSVNDVDQETYGINGHSSGRILRHNGDEESDGQEYEDSEASEGDEEDDEDEDDEDEDEEPTLKYERLGGSVHDLLQKDSASALAYSQKKLVRLTTHVYAFGIVPMKARFLEPMQASSMYWTWMGRD